LPKSYTLKKGDFFELRDCIDTKTQERRSVKIYRKNELDDLRLSQVKKEIELLRRLDHANIARIVDVIEDDHKIYCITNLIKG
jgi:serine/threonine protein kinase